MESLPGDVSESAAKAGFERQHKIETEGSRSDYYNGPESGRRSCPNHSILGMGSHEDCLW